MAKRTRFDANALRDFLNSGWLLAFDADQILVGWGEWSESAMAPQSSWGGAQCAVYAPDFYLKDEKPWKVTANWDIVSHAHFANHFLTGIGRNVNCEPLNWQEPASKDFAKCWQMIQEGFRERGLQKAVPVVFASAKADFSKAESRQSLLLRLLHSFHSLRVLSQTLGLRAHPLYLYGMWSESSGLIGATPEVLFTRTSQQAVIHTMALAGTRGKVAVEDPELLLRDVKERHEHQLVIDDLKCRLGGIGEATIGLTRVLELPSLYHLLTPIEVCPLPDRSTSFVELVDLLHPTPALGVAPRALGFGEIRRWDQLGDERQRFGAPFGATWGGREHCVVAIRNVQWQSDELKLGSGCGVIEESEFDREWRELSLKRESVKRMLGL